VLFNFDLPSTIVAKAADAKSRSIVKIALTPDARRIVDSLKDETGIAKQESVGRILEWFSKQSTSVRRSIVTGLGDPADELVKLKMADMAADPGSGSQNVSFDRAVHSMRLLLDTVVDRHEEVIKVARMAPGAKKADPK
jgi:hypothetical protein